MRLGSLVFYFLKSDKSTHHLGIVASRKTGCAAVRNRFRRRVRCLYEHIEEKLISPHDVVVIATSASAVESSFSQLQAFFVKALERVFYIENNGRVHA